MRASHVVAASLLAVLAVGLNSCATVTGFFADTLIPVEQENQLGEEFQQQLGQEIDYYRDRELTYYVRDRGAEIVEAAGDDVPEGIEFEFHIVDDDAINAFAIPGGGIYVNTGLLEAADNEAELMGVLGHEVGHVTERHIARRLVTAYGASAVTQMALGQDPGLLGQLVGSIAQQGAMLTYSRANEREADERGVEYMIDAGYNPEGFISFFEKLDERPSPPAFLSSHPPPGDRADDIRQQIQLRGGVPDRLGTERFQQMRDRL